MMVVHRKNRFIGCEAGVHLRLLDKASADAIDVVVGSGIAEVKLAPGITQRRHNCLV